MKTLVNILLAANLLQLFVSIFLIEYALQKHDEALFANYLNKATKTKLQKQVVKTNKVIKDNTLYLPW